MTRNTGVPPARASIALCLLFTLGGAGCAPPPPRCLALRSQTLIVGAWRHEAADLASGLAPGIDLDGRGGDGRGPSCADAADFASPETGATSVDNQYAAQLLPLLEEVPPFDAGMTSVVGRDLLAGDSLLGFEVRVDGATGAASVDLVELAATETVRLDPTLSGLAADQTFRVTSRTPVAASCTGDALELAWPRLDLPLGEPLDARPIENVRARLDVDRVGRVRAGELGGEVSLETIASVIEAMSGSPVDVATARAFASPDLHPDPRTLECSGVSLGVALDLVPARFVE